MSSINSVKPYLSFRIGFIAVFAIIVMTITAAGIHMRDTLIQNSALSYAKIYSEAIEQFRSLYASEVVKPMRNKGDISVRHDYKEHEHAIPLPATFSILLGEKIVEEVKGAKVRIYSDYPFPWRETSGGLQDEFARTAWKSLQDSPNQPYYSFNNAEGLSLRYAKADILNESCIDCHNRHPDSPKRDWKVGDVRGILEVELPLGTLLKDSLSELYTSFALFGALLCVMFIGILKVIFDVENARYQLSTEQAKLKTENRLRREAEAVALKNKERSEAANRAKSTFLSTMSHELRTPMNAIIGFTGILLRRKAEDSPDTELLKRIETASNTLLSLINDVLDLSKIEAGKIKFETIPFNLPTEVENVVTLFEESCKQKGIAIHVDVSDAIPTPLYGDPVRVKQVITNFISNASKFTESGSIRISVTLVKFKGGWAHIKTQVADTGIGMSQEQLDKVFTPFVQADGSTHRRFGGTGLGLSIAKEFIQMMKGDVTVESTEGKGSTFSFDLHFPVTKTAAELSTELSTEPSSVTRVGDEIEKQSGAASNLRLFDSVKRATRFQQHTIKPDTAFQNQVRLLVAEGDDEAETILSDLLTELGYTYKMVNDGHQFLEAIQDSNFDLALLGVELPEMDGFEITTQLRKTRSYDQLPIIGLATPKLKENAENCLLAGMNDYLLKPYEFNDVERKLLTWVKKIKALWLFSASVR